MKRLRNSSGIPDETVTAVVEWIAGRLGITQFDVKCRSSQSTVAGRAYTTGARSYHGSRRSFVVLRIGTEMIERWTTNDGKRIALRRSWLGCAHQETAVKVSRKRFLAFIRPCQYAYLKGRRYVLANRIEALVYLAAHELRHLWQAARVRDDRKSARRAMYRGARGKFSEVDTEGFAIILLRESRRTLALEHDTPSVPVLRILYQ